MLSLPKSTTNGNGHAGTVNGRGLARRKLTPEQWIDLAADLACGQYKLEPSLLQISRLCGVPVHHLRDELKRRSAAQDHAAATRWAVQCEAEAENARIDAEAETVVDTATATAVDNMVADGKSTTKLVKKLSKKMFRLHDRVDSAIATARNILADLQFYGEPFDEAVTWPSGRPLFSEEDRQIIHILKAGIEAHNTYQAAVEAETRCADENDDVFLEEAVSAD
jgi:hypothetical protein